MESHHGNALFYAVAVAAFLQPVSSKEVIAFHLAPNTRLSKHADLEVEFWPRSATLDGGEFGALSDYLIKFHAALQVLDQYGPIENGRPIQVQREFVQISGTWADPWEVHDIAGFDRLEGCSVVFEWRQGPREYAPHIEGGDRSCKRVPVTKIDEDFDLRAILPPEKVALGDRWEVTGRKLGTMLLYSADVGAAGIAEEHGFEEFVSELLLPQLRDAIDGSRMVCKFVESEDVEGARVAKIAMDVAGRGVVDVEHQLEVFAQSAFPSVDRDWAAIIRNARVDYRVRATGMVSWSITGGHFISLDLETEFELATTATVVGLFGGDSKTGRPVDCGLTLAGKGKLIMTAAHRE